LTEKKDTHRERLTSRRQQEILNAAVKVFAKKGFNGATTREIAKEAGVAEGTIFRYFKTKKDLLLNLACPLILNTLVDAMDEVAGQTDEIVLKTILKNRLSLISKNHDLVRLLFIEGQFHPEIRKQFTENIVLKAAGIMENFISGKIREGVYKDINPQVAARMFVGMAAIFVLWNEFLYSDSGIKFDLETVTDNIVDIFLNGIKNKGEEEA